MNEQRTGIDEGFVLGRFLERRTGLDLAAFVKSFQDEGSNIALAIRVLSHGALQVAVLNRLEDDGVIVDADHLDPFVPHIAQ